MTEKTELCGFQTTGRSEDVPKPPKYNLNAEFWRTQWSEASGAHLMEYLRAEKLQEQLQEFAEENERLRNALEDIRTNTPIQELLDLPFSCSCHEIARQALAAIGGNDED